MHPLFKKLKPKTKTDMYVFIAILIIVACILLTLIVLIQNPKGGGIAANFVAPNQIMGVKRSTDVVEKATWILAATLIILALGSNFARPTSGDADAAVKESRLKDNIENAALPPTPPAQNPGATEQQTPPTTATPEDGAKPE